MDERPEPGDNCERQDALIDAIERAIINTTEEWTVTAIDVIGALESVKWDYQMIVHNEDDEDET